MNGKDLFLGLNYISRKYIEEAERDTISDAMRASGGKYEEKTGRPLRRPLLIAAIVALMLVLAGCAVVYVLTLQDMKIGEQTHYEAGYTTPEGETVPAQEWTTTLISLQGYKNSPPQLAMQEWLAYLDSYDQDDALMKANNMNESGLPENYFITYSCYTWEMKDRLDGILEKYALNALGAYTYIDHWEIQILFDALQIRGICRENSEVETDRLAGYFTPEGTFHVEGGIAPTGSDAAWPYDIIVSYRYSLIDYLDPVYSGVRNIETVDQWNYESEDGTQLLLVRDGEQSTIICDRGKAFITIHLHDFSDEGGLSKEALEQLAEGFDYSIRPQPADMERVAQMLAESEEPYDPSVHGYYIGFQIDPTGTWHPPEGYDDSIERYLTYVQEKGEPENQYYALADVDGDGIEEVLLGNQEGQLYELVYMKEDMVAIRFLTYLCEGNVLEKYYHNQTYYFSDEKYEEGCTVHEYSTLAESIAMFYYLPKSNQWIKTDFNEALDLVSEEVLSAAEVRHFMARYPRVELDMKPISEYPMD